MVIKLLSFGMKNPMFQNAMKVRKAVFVEEMGIDPQIDFDEFDIDSAHFLIDINDKPIATARWRETEKGVKIERLAVLKQFRSQGFGQLLLRQIILDVLPSKKTIYLHSPTNLVDFFIWNGFEPTDEKVEELGHEAIMMIYIKDKANRQAQRKNLISRIIKGKN